MSKTDLFPRLLFLSSVFDEADGSHYAETLREETSIHQNIAQVGKLYGDLRQHQAAAFVHKVPYIDFTTWNILHDQLVRFCDPTAIPGFNYTPVDITDNVIVIACDKPLDPSFKSALRRIIANNYEFVLVTGPLEQLVSLSEAARNTQKTNISQLGQSVQIHETVVTAAEKFSVADEALTAEDIFQRFEKSGGHEAKASDLVRALLMQAHSQGASDVHIEPGNDLKSNFTVRYRIDGQCINRGTFGMQLFPQLSTGIKQMSTGMDLSLRGVPQDGRIKIIVRTPTESGLSENIQLDIRVACVPTGSTAEWEKFVFRILEGSKGLPALQDILSDTDTLKLVNEVLDMPNGLVLITGPTGSGKTTTLARFVTEVNKPNYTIYTVEDPIEYQIGNVTQTQVNEAKGLKFADILRSHLRMDPDIILVGEIRDNETAGIVIKAALTGHQVFSTLHTLDAAGAIPRLIDMGVESYLLADALTYVAAQRLAQKICPHCTQPENVGKEVLEKLPKELRTATYYKGVGCQKCKNLGYRGRVTVIESLYVDHATRDMIARKAPIHEIREHNKAYSGNLFEQAVKIAAQKKTTLKEAFLLNVEVKEEKET
jgi:type II secretory ATPase GspE/PulE/Tfp pilus assembly ATPase PilB-like protein